uniref:Uncharacterized protein n=1 Tax=Picea glauca TaxID=3330 RepID=A0A101M1Y7_PICGL|nr:hypothetical protein ABT39_MTgene3983 [Picea glauca]QHR86973.1 hypothetical protein Q903MT_gene982 [Picea sitchensis]
MGCPSLAHFTFSHPCRPSPLGSGVLVVSNGITSLIFCSYLLLTSTQWTPEQLLFGLLLLFPLMLLNPAFHFIHVSKPHLHANLHHPPIPR